MMTEAIIVAVLATISNIVVSYISNRKSTALVEYRLKQLEDKVNKHNNLIDRTYNLEKQIAVIQEDIKELQQ